MTESTVTAENILKELSDSLVQLIEGAEGRRKSASAKNENYKIEYSEGEKHAYGEIAKTIKAALSKI